MAEQKNGNRVGWGVALVLATAVLTGGGMAVRGDWLGQEHAEAVEGRLNIRLDGVEERTERRLERMEDKIDQLLARN